MNHSHFKWWIIDTFKHHNLERCNTRWARYVVVELLGQLKKEKKEKKYYVYTLQYHCTDGLIWSKYFVKKKNQDIIFDILIIIFFRALWCLMCRPVWINHFLCTFFLSIPSISSISCSYIIIIFSCSFWPLGRNLFCTLPLGKKTMRKIFIPKY